MKTEQPPHFPAKDDGVATIREIIKNTVAVRGHEAERRLIKSLAAELNLSFLDCAAALASTIKTGGHKRNGAIKTLPHHVAPPLLPKMKLVRYRLAVGHAHQISLEEIKKVLVEESGVDINNIANVRIQDVYTLIDLPDEMPQEIFQHLKAVEIKQQKLDIKRVKNRNRMRNNRKQRPSQKTGDNPIFAKIDGS